MSSKWEKYWTGKRVDLQAAVNRLRTHGSPAYIDISDITTITTRKEINGGIWLKMIAHKLRYASGNIGAEELANVLEPMLKDGESIMAKVESDNQKRWLKLKREMFSMRSGKWEKYWTGKRANLQVAVNQLRTYGSARIDISNITTITIRKEINGCRWLKIIAHESRSYTSGNIGAEELANVLEPMLKDSESIMAKVESDNQKRWLKLENV